MAASGVKSILSSLQFNRHRQTAETLPVIVVTVWSRLELRSAPSNSEREYSTPNWSRVFFVIFNK